MWGNGRGDVFQASLIYGHCLQLGQSPNISPAPRTLRGANKALTASACVLRNVWPSVTSSEARITLSTLLSIIDRSRSTYV